MFESGDKIICISDVADPLYKSQTILKEGDIFTVEYQIGKKVSLFESTYYLYSKKHFISLLEYRIEKINKIKDNICSKSEKN